MMMLMVVDLFLIYFWTFLRHLIEQFPRDPLRIHSHSSKQQASQASQLASPYQVN